MPYMDRRALEQHLTQLNGDLTVGAKYIERQRQMVARKRDAIRALLLQGGCCKRQKKIRQSLSLRRTGSRRNCNVYLTALDQIPPGIGQADAVAPV